MEMASSRDEVSTSSVSFRRTSGRGFSPLAGALGRSLRPSTTAARLAGAPEGSDGVDGPLDVPPPFPKVKYPGQPHFTFFMSRLKFMLGIAGIFGIGGSGKANPDSA